MIIIIIIMDGSCIAQVLMSRKLKALARIIHADIHTYINIIYPPPPNPPTPTPNTHYGLPRFLEMPVEKGKF